MSTLLSSLRVAVVGGGVSGVATAASLFKLGCKHVIVYDQHPSLSALHHANPPALILQPNGTRILDALDLLPSLSTAAAPIHRITQRSTRGRQLSSYAPTAFLHSRTKAGHTLTALAVPYAALHAALTSQLPDDAVQWDSRIASVQRCDGGYRLAVDASTAEAVLADVVVAADGADSALRGEVVRGGAGVGAPLGLGGVLMEGVSRGSIWDEQADNELLEVSGGGQRMGAVRLLDGTVYWYATVNAGSADLTSSPRALASALSSLPTWASDLATATPNTSYTAVPLRHLPPSAPLYRDGVVLVGSSSALLPPDLHQRAAASLESALTLALSLRSATTAAGGMQRYSAKRTPRLASLHAASLSECQRAIQTSRLVSHLRGMVGSLLPAAVRDAVLETAIGYDVLKQFPEWRDWAPKAKLCGQAGQNFADRIETDLKDLDDVVVEQLRGASGRR